MTENPTILSPSGPSQPPPPVNSTVTPEDAEDSSGEINCICEISDDDGFTICCDKCDTWQHLVCVQITKENLPAKYYCPKCSPRQLDVSKAKEIQRQRRADEQAKRSHKKKRPAATSHKKKEHTNGSNGSALGKMSSTTEKATAQGLGKLPSPKEVQQPSARKRGHRASQSTNIAGSHPSLQPAAVGPTAFINNSAAVPPCSPNVPVSTRSGETESDTDYEKSTKKYKQEYTSISANSPDQYADLAVQTFIENLASPSSGYLADHGEPLIHYGHEKFASIVWPKISVRPLPDSSRSYSGSGCHRPSLVLETPVSPGQLVTMYKGEVAFTKSRQDEFKNQFDVLCHPKLYVLFHPNLPIYIDARKCGSHARFVRRSCRPNLEVRTVVVEKQVCFGLFAKDAIRTGTPLTLSWDCGETPEASELARESVEWNMVRAKTLNKLANRTIQLTKKIGDCQCSGGNDCPLAKIKNGASVLKPPSANGIRRKLPVKGNPSTEPSMPVASKEPSPERGSAVPNDDDEDDNRSVSVPSSRSKPRSRDLTPSTVPDTAVETGEMTGREARKFKEVLSRIEKQQQEEQLPSVKRRKRNSTASLPAGTLPLPSPGIELKDGMKGVEISKKQKLPAHQRSPYSPPATTPGSISAPGEYTVTDASVGRRESDSPVHSEMRKQRPRVSVSPVGHKNGGDLVKHRSKTIVKPRQPEYKNASVQTDNIEDETPWWQQDHQVSPPRPPRLPLRKRLMQSLLRDREEAVAISAGDKKRKHEDTAPNSLEGSPALKSVKLSSDGNAPAKSTPPTDIKQSEVTESIALSWAAANTVKSAAQDSAAQALAIKLLDPNTAKLPSVARPPGPALADIFADPDPPAPHQVHGATVLLKSLPEQTQTSTSNDQSLVNGFRSPGLYVQLPPSSNPPGTPTTPALQSTPTPSTVALQSPLSVIPNLANASNSVLNNSLVQPSPTRTKKLSLQDYGKRKQKVETVDKIERLE